jgi:hypothetical protein
MTRRLTGKDKRRHQVYRTVRPSTPPWRREWFMILLISTSLEPGAELSGAGYAVDHFTSPEAGTEPRGDIVFQESIPFFFSQELSAGLFARILITIRSLPQFHYLNSNFPRR